ncbi:hypothetical protein B0I21_1121 [Sphingobacterium paludis]|uniref:Uncharacterized protein n=1 Tax=Sphingobacterium paludis TaxID=1476465 RepID=A0A4R7CRX7_9SPHI|nr:hypothetical protein B0I21_1121 [Sphingobacterium paludis]
MDTDIFSDPDLLALDTEKTPTKTIIARDTVYASAGETVTRTVSME